MSENTENAEEEPDKSYDIRLKGPFTLQVVAPSRSGKTTWIFTLLEYANELIDPKPDIIYFCYSEKQKDFEKFPHVNFIEGFDPELVSKKNLEGKGHVVIILDDLVDSLLKSDILGPLWTRISHHRFVSAILTQQNYFPVGLKSSTDINRNSCYKCIFKNNSEALQTVLLGRSLFPKKSKFWNEVITDVFSKPYNYLLIDNRNDTPEEIRLRTGIFPHEQTVCYAPKETSLLYSKNNEN